MGIDLLSILATIETFLEVQKLEVGGAYVTNTANHDSDNRRIVSSAQVLIWPNGKLGDPLLNSIQDQRICMILTSFGPPIKRTK